MAGGACVLAGEVEYPEFIEIMTSTLAKLADKKEEEGAGGSQVDTHWPGLHDWVATAAGWRLQPCCHLPVVAAVLKNQALSLRQCCKHRWRPTIQQYAAGCSR